MRSYFTVVRQLVRNRLMLGQTEVEEMLDEVLLMANVDNMELKAYFVYNSKLYITFEENKSIIEDIVFKPKKLKQNEKKKTDSIKESYGKKHVPQGRKKSRKS